MLMLITIKSGFILVKDPYMVFYRLVVNLYKQMSYITQKMIKEL